LQFSDIVNINEKSYSLPLTVNQRKRQKIPKEKSEAVDQTDNTIAKRKRTWTNNGQNIPKE
jgi:hypothetical protein